MLVLSRKLRSRRMLGPVDWQVLPRFIGRFILNDAFERTGVPVWAVAELVALGIDLHRPAALFGVPFVLSNLVSNVPAVMLLLPVASPQDGALLGPGQYSGGEPAGGGKHREPHRHGSGRPDGTSS